MVGTLCRGDGLWRGRYVEERFVEAPYKMDDFLNVQYIFYFTSDKEEDLVMAPPHHP